MSAKCLQKSVFNIFLWATATGHWKLRATIYSQPIRLRLNMERFRCKLSGHRAVEDKQLWQSIQGIHLRNSKCHLKAIAHTSQVGLGDEMRGAWQPYSGGRTDKWEKINQSINQNQSVYADRFKPMTERFVMWQQLIDRKNVTRSTVPSYQKHKLCGMGSIMR